MKETNRKTKKSRQRQRSRNGAEVASNQTQRPTKRRINKPVRHQRTSDSPWIDPRARQSQFSRDPSEYDRPRPKKVVNDDESQKRREAVPSLPPAILRYKLIRWKIQRADARGNGERKRKKKEENSDGQSRGREKVEVTKGPRRKGEERL